MVICDFGMVVGARAFQKLLIYWDFHTNISRVYREGSGQRDGVHRAAALWAKMLCWWQRRLARLVQVDRKARVTQLVCKRASLNAQHVEPGLQQQETTPGAAHAKNRKQATIHKGFPNLEEALPGLSFHFCFTICMIRSEQHESRSHPASYQQFRLLLVL